MFEILIFGKDPYFCEHLFRGLEGYRKKHDLRWRFRLIKPKEVPRLSVSIGEAHSVVGQLDNALIEDMRQHRPDLITISVSGACTDCQTFSVIADQSMAGRQAVDHLSDVGYRQIGYWGFWGSDLFRQREQAMLQRCDELGLPMRRLTLDGGHHSKGRIEADIVALLESQPKPLGVITRQDDDAIYLRDLCVRNGIDVPGEIGLLGYNDNPIQCCLGRLTISSVRVPWQHMGHEIARVLHGLQSDEERPQENQTVRPYGVQQRMSTNLAQSHRQDPLVRKFMGLAERAALRGKGVGDLLPQLGCSQQTLYTHVMDAIGRAPSVCILDLRVQSACELLRDTDLEIKEIAQKCGFASFQRLHAAFVARYDMAPRVWRKG